ncbi:MAG: hypothetical protein IPH66_04525 [Crocinitomicaceae bacterium]|nr:hypothetical protein [Crocinitomicaceae bacterium]
MNKLTAIHIPVQRKRLYVAVSIYILFAAVLFFSLFYLAEFTSDTLSLIIKIVAGVIAAFLVIAGASAGKLLQDKTAGLTIDANGIMDKSSAIGCGFIAWKNIRSIEADSSVTLVKIHVKSKEEIYKSAANKAIRQVLEKNAELYQTPVVIEKKYLACTFDELMNKLNEGVKKYKK